MLGTRDDPESVAIGDLAEPVRVGDESAEPEL